MRVTAILMVHDDVVTLPACIDHLRRIGVDRIVALDTGSTDGSLDILSDAERAGDLWSLVLDGDEGARNVELTASQLARESGADWVVFLRANEFLIPVTGRVDGVAELEHADALSVFRYHLVGDPSGTILSTGISTELYDQLLLYARPEATFDDLGAIVEGDVPGRWLGPGVMARPRVLGRLLEGGTGIEVNDVEPWRQRTAADMFIARVVSNAVAPVGPPAHEEDGLCELRRRLVVRSATDILGDPVGQLAVQDRAETLGRTQPWLIMAGRVCAAEGIAVGHRLEPTFPSTYPTVLAPPGHVVKLFPRANDGHAVLAREASGLVRARRGDALPVPELVATGELDDEWRYLVMTLVPGQNLTFILDSLGSEAIRGVAAWVGDFSRRLHGLPLGDDEVAGAAAGFSVLVEHLRLSASGRLSDRRALPDHLLSQVDAWLPSTDELISAPGSMSLLHGDLEDDHVFVSASESAVPKPLAIIDFGDSMIGHPYYDLGPAWWTWLNLDRSYLDAFLEAAQWPGQRDAGFARLAMAWSLIRCSWNPKPPPFLSRARDLDELARLSFGVG